MDEWTVRWIDNWLSTTAQRAVISHAESSWNLVACGVPQGQFWIQSYATYSSMTWMKWTPSKFADDAKLGGVAGRPKGFHSGRYDRLETWVERYTVKFKEHKCRALYLGKRNPKISYTSTG